MKYFFYAILSGVLFSLAWPTYGFPFLIFFAFFPLFLIEDEISPKRKSVKVLALSYLSFLIWNVATTGWLHYVKNPDGTPSLFSFLFPVLVNSLLMSAVFMAYHWYKKWQGMGLGLLFFVALWMCFEKLHLEWEFSWPWLNLGNIFADYPKFIQWYDTLGATGGSFWILMVNALLFYSLRVFQVEKSQRILNKNLGVLSVLVLVPMIISLIKFYQFEEKHIGKVRVMMLQPNLDPYTEKYEKDSIQIMNELLDLAKKSDGKIDYFLTPETSIPANGELSETGFHDSESIKMITDFLKTQPKSVLMGGASTYRIYKDDETKSETASFYPNQNIWADRYNSAIQVVPNKKVEVYHKTKRVPGVEIFPYMNGLKPLLGDQMINLGGIVSSLGFDKERKVFCNPYNKGKIAPIICYESIYGEFVTDYIKNGANFLAVVTNDSWWSDSQGHKQHFSYAKLRAIETRRELVQAANGGISGHINARGEVLAQTKYDETTTLISEVKLYDNQTFYSVFGDVLTGISKVGVLILLTLGIFKKNKIA